MPSQEKLTIRFKAEGQGELKQAFTALNSATRKLVSTQKKLKKELTKVTGNQKKAKKAVDKYSEALVKNHRNSESINKSLGKFGKTMSGIRSKMLIVAFAAGLLTKAFKSLNDAFVEYEKLNRKIDAVLRSTRMSAGLTAKALDDMANSLERSMGVSSTAVKEMQARLLTFTNITAAVFFKAEVAAINMANVFGQDLSQATIQLGKALNDPIKGYTALRRIGVSFTNQQVESIRVFQEQGDVIGAQTVILDELEREFGGVAKASTKAAIGAESFRLAGAELQALMRDLGETLQPVIFLLGEFSRAVIQTGKDLIRPITLLTQTLPLFIAYATGAKQVKDSLDFFENLGSQIASSNQALGELSGGFRDAATSAKGFEDMRTRAGVLMSEIDDLAESATFFKENTEELDKKLAEFATMMQRINSIISTQKTKQDMLEESQKKSAETLRVQSELLQARLDLGRELTTLEALEITFADELSESQIKYAEALDEANQKLEEQAVLQEAKQETWEIMKEIGQQQMEFAKETAQAELEIINEKEKRELEALRNTFEYKKATDKKKAQMEKDVVKKHEALEEAVRNKANERMKKAFMAEQLFNIRLAVMQTGEAYTKALPNIPLSIFVAALGAAQVAMIAAQQPPKMQYGGLVGGNRHSAGGTLLEAERGEFVVSRIGVDATGLETLNRINAGEGGGGGTSIVINNPILGKDIIEDEVVPQIKEALRRGGDIGI